MKDNHKLTEYIDSLLPLYANGRANRLQRMLVEFRLKDDESARQRLVLVRDLQRGLREDASVPSNAVWARIHASIKENPSPTIQPGVWRLGMGLAVLLLLIVWFAFPPKVVLEWTVAGNIPQEFHIYRAREAGSQEFMLLQEIPGNETLEDYRFVDLQLLPSRYYAYKIEAISQNGEPLSTELIFADGTSTLPSQLALLLTLSVSFYGLGVFLSERKHWPETNMRLRTG